MQEPQPWMVYEEYMQEERSYILLSMRSHPVKNHESAVFLGKKAVLQKHMC